MKDEALIWWNSLPLIEQEWWADGDYTIENIIKIYKSLEYK